MRELLRPANRIRFFLGAMLFTFQNSTGSSALAVFGPQFFALLVGSSGMFHASLIVIAQLTLSGNNNLLLTGIFGAVKVIACTFFIFVIAERFGRRTLLISGALAMAACMLTVGLLDDFKRPPKTGVVTPAGKAMVALIYLDIMIYNCSWYVELLSLVRNSWLTTSPGVLSLGRTSQRSSQHASAPSAWEPPCSLIGRCLLYTSPSPRD